MCLVCWTELESCGIRPYRLQAPEDDEDEATKKELDEEVRRQEESLFKDTVHQAQENVSESNDYGFNPDEVDYNEGDDEEMDQKRKLNRKTTKSLKKKMTMRWRSNLRMNLHPNYQHGPRILSAEARVCRETDLSTMLSPRPRLTYTTTP